MENIVWSDEFQVGVAILDQQHRRLISMINKLIGSSPVTTRSETVSEILDDMTRYAREHFATEEKLLDVHGCPQLEEHRKQHQAYQKKTAEFCCATTLGVPEVPGALLAYLREWWLHHILEEDMKYKPFLEGTEADRRTTGCRRRVEPRPPRQGADTSLER